MLVCNLWASLQTSALECDCLTLMILVQDMSHAMPCSCVLVEFDQSYMAGDIRDIIGTLQGLPCILQVTCSCTGLQSKQAGPS